MSTVKFCKSKSGEWLLFGFLFQPKQAWRACIVCYNKDKMYKKKNNMYILEVASTVKDMYLSDNEGDNIMAESILKAEFKKSKKILLKYK